jgi:HK97 gp10 family phage protein
MLTTSSRFRVSGTRGAEQVIVEGLDAVVDGFDNAGRTAGLRASRVVVDVARQIGQTQRDLVATRSRKTQESIEATTPDGGPLGLGDLEAEIGPTWFVGRFLEFGTVNMAPHAFVFPSADRHLSDFERRLGLVAGDM